MQKCVFTAFFRPKKNHNLFIHAGSYGQNSEVIAQKKLFKA